jgi:DNA-directed RNA polymerase subunit L
MTEKDVKTIETFAEVLANEIKSVDETLIPLLREYLNNIRDIRMAMAREVRHIIESTREISTAATKHQEIRELAISIGMLDKILTPELVEKLKKITKDL